MIEGVPFAVTDLSGWGAFLLLAFIVVLAFVRGKVYPESALRAERAVTATFKEAWEKAVEASERQDAAMLELIPNTRTTVRLLEAMQAAAHDGTEGDPT